MVSELKLDHTLAICVRKEAAPFGYETVPVADLDLTLCIRYWQVAPRYWEWEVYSAIVEGETVTPKSDPEMWKIIERGVTKKFSDLDGEIQDMISEREWA